MDKINVLSLFDGVSMARVALEKVGIEIDNYYASEIDQYAITIAQKNYPDTIQLGDITTIDTTILPKIDLIVAGFPCQGFSMAGLQKGLDDPRGQLVYDLMRVFDEVNPEHFLFENVASMSQANKDALSDIIGTGYITIDAGLVSAQTRKRIFWSDFRITQPDNQSLLMEDILEPRENCVDITDRMMMKKEGTLAYKNAWRFVRAPNQKCRTLTTGGQNIANTGATNLKFNDRYYKLSEIECERLMGLPDLYTTGVSSTQRYRALGNGFNVDVMAHIFKCMIKNEAKAVQTSLFGV